MNFVTVSFPTDVIIGQEKHLKVYSGSWVKAAVVRGLGRRSLKQLVVLSTQEKQRVTYAHCHSYPLSTTQSRTHLTGRASQGR